MKQDREFVHPSPKELLILQILNSATNPKVGIGGLDIVKQSDGQIGRGTIYVTLDRMQDKGFVESRRCTDAQLGNSPGAHNFSSYRRLYTITGYGVRVLSAVMSTRSTFEKSFSFA